ncbi:MAG: flavin reductase family protein [Gemmatimonadota bacterium]|nr:flavin reductase family protein [Gemmatimonadota bacterium]
MSGTMDRPATDVPVVSEADFRHALAELAGGVVLVTATGEDGRGHGCTATSVCSVSLSPPLVLACLTRDSATREAIRATGRFALNLLAAGQEDLSDRFARAAADKFDGVAHRPGTLGVPLVDGCLAACECEVERTVAAGDHDVVIGRVVRAEAGSAVGRKPLVWFRRGYADTREPDG